MGHLPQVHVCHSSGWCLVGVGPVVHGLAPVPLVHHPEPRHDLDMASYGVVRMLPGGPGSGYNGLGWEPKRAFAALAQAVTDGGRGPSSLPVK